MTSSRFNVVSSYMRINYLLTVVMFGVITIYFTYSALNGQYGLFNKFRFQAQEVVLLEKLEEIKLRNAVLENKVLRLSDEYLDLELLDQQARKFLGLARSNEIIIGFK